MRALLLGVMITLSACATTPEVRSLALETQALAQRYAGDTATFLQRQDGLRASASARLDDLRRDTVVLERDAWRAEQAWRISGDTSARALYETATVHDADYIWNAMQAPAPAPVQSVAGAPDLTKVIASLSEIARDPTRADRRRQALSFVRVVAAETQRIRAGVTTALAPPAAEHGEN